MKKQSILAGVVSALALTALAATAMAQTADPFRMPRAPVPPANLQAPANPTLRAGANDVQFYSEQVLLKGKLFVPANFSAQSNAPGVVLAPGLRQTAASVEAYAQALANKGVAALVFDYRGWGRSGGFIYMPPDVRLDDRLRFTYHTPKLTIRRGRVDLDAQVQDLRNATTYLQSIPGVDRNRVGLLGVGQGGGNVIQTAGMDSRIRGVAAIMPVINGRDAPMLSYVPTPAIQADLIRLARMAPPKTAAEATAMNALEARVSLAEFRPFMFLGQIQPTVPVLFVSAPNDATVTAAAAKVTGPKEVKSIAGATANLTAAQVTEAANAAADWLSTRMTAAPPPPAGGGRGGPPGAGAPGGGRGGPPGGPPGGGRGGAPGGGRGAQ